MSRSLSLQTANTPTDDQLVAILERCGGVPLAIHLWARYVPLVREGLSQALMESPVKAEGDPLASALEGVYQLVLGAMQPAERQLVRRLAILPDGLTLAGTIAVCSRLDSGPDAKAAGLAAGYLGPLQELLNRLVTRGLVVAGLQTNGEMRYRVEGSLREFLRQELEQSEECAPLREAVVQYLTGFAETVR